jgi:hypothetical protein
LATLVLVLGLAAACVTGPEHEVEARWARGERPPDRLVEHSTPRLSPEGIELRRLDCSVTADELHYRLELTNPYPGTLDAWAFTSIDGPTQGHLWGLYQFPMPSGSVAVTFADPLDDEARDGVIAAARNEVGDVFESCSVVFLGVADDPETAFVHPVITGRLGDRR